MIRVPDFDGENGYLPIGCHECDLDTFKQHFVVDFDSSKNRPKIYKKYLKYTKRFKKILIKIWLNGSYTTLKKEPNDLDIVVHYDVNIANKLNKITFAEKMAFNDQSSIKKEYMCHTFPIPIYPTNDPRNILSEKQSNKALKWFSKDRDGIEKGIVEIKYRSN